MLPKRVRRPAAFMKAERKRPKLNNREMQQKLADLVSQANKLASSPFAMTEDLAKDIIRMFDAKDIKDYMDKNGLYLSIKHERFYDTIAIERRENAS